MNRKSLLVMLVLICSTVFAFSQTLKITDVDADDQRLYDSATKRYLGKKMIIEEFDKSVRITVGNEKPLIMKRDERNHAEYSARYKETEHEITHVRLTVDKTLGVTTAAIFTLTISEKQGYQHASYVVTAKRF